MSLVDKQHEHSVRLARLIIFADQQGYQVSGGDWYRDKRCDYGHAKSLHLLRLATDLNLFRDGIWLTDTESHRPLGEYWESLNGSWGGRFENNPDGNHYSTEYRGMK